TAPDLDLVPGTRARGREEQRHAVSVITRFLAAVRVLESAVEKPGWRRIDQSVLRIAVQARLLVAEVLGPVDVVRTRGGGDPFVWIGRLGAVAVLGVPQREMRVRAVDAVQTIQRPGQPGKLGQVGKVGIAPAHTDRTVRTQVGRL